MAHYGRLGKYVTDDPSQDIRGRDLYGWNDEKLGRINDVIFDHSAGDIAYVIVDTGGWFKSKKFVMPAARLRLSHKHDGDFACDLTKRQVESFPPYEESHLSSEQKWSDYENLYRSAWESLPVIFRAELTRRAEPTTEAETSGLSAGETELKLTKSWSAFQALLRQRRMQLIAQCSFCKHSE